MNESTTTKTLPAGLPASIALVDDTKRNKKKQTTNVRNLLMYKKSLAEYLDETVSKGFGLSITSFADKPSLYF